MKFDNSNVEFPSIYHIENFNYNGFYVIPLSGFAKFKVKEFLYWTNDPGIGKFLCSDGKAREIPTCQLHPYYLKTLPKPPKLKNPILFGNTSSSRS